MLDGVRLPQGCALPQLHCASMKKSLNSLMHIAGQTSVTLVTVLREMPHSPVRVLENQNPVFSVNEADRLRTPAFKYFFASPSMYLHKSAASKVRFYSFDSDNHRLLPCARPKRPNWRQPRRCPAEKDAGGRNGSGGARCLCGEGPLEFGSFLSALFENGFPARFGNIRVRENLHARKKACVK